MREDDPRYKRSRRLLREAIIQLSHEDLDKVTVSAVCERTGIDRATFYRHVPDIEHLVADTLGALADEAASAWDLGSDGSGMQEELSHRILSQYLSHVEANWALYKWALGPGGSAAAMHVVLDRISLTVETELRRLPSFVPKDDIGRHARFAAGALFGACVGWLSEQDPIPAAEFAAWLHAELVARFDTPVATYPV